MERRVLLAFLLSTILLAAWYYFFVPSPQPPKPSPPTEQQAQQPKPTEPAAQASQAQPLPEPSLQLPEREVRVETPLWRATFSNHGAVARSWTIKQLPNGRKILGSDHQELELIPQLPEVVGNLGRPFAIAAQDETLKRALQESNYAVSSDDTALQVGQNQTKELTFSFRHEQAGLEITKKFVFHGGSYDFEFSVDVQQHGRPLEVQLIVGPSFGDQSIKKTDYYTLKAPLFIAQHGESVQRIDAGKIPDQPLTGDIRWTGIQDNYFAFVLIPQQPINQVNISGNTIKENRDDEEVERHFIAAAVPVNKDQVYTVFAGPQDADSLRALSQKLGGVNLENVINYGFFSSVIKPIINWVMIPALDFAHRYTGNYGVAIIVLTLLINMFFFPLRRSSSAKMKKAATIQPRIREIQEKMKGLKRDDPKWQQLQMEQLKLMKEANPLGGCLPMLLQLPIFWAVFVLLTISFDVRQAPFFGWIDDLSSPDRWHVLPIAMCISMIASTVMTPTPSPDPSQKFQKIMMAYLMPIALTFLFFWSAPSGLVLYWMFSNIAGIIQQALINRLTPATTTTPAAEGKKGATKPAVST